jgi:hypothetical protein
MLKKLTSSKRTRARVYVFCLISSFPLTQIGCTQTASSSAPVVNGAAATEIAKTMGEPVDNPDYLRWHRFPLGTRVVRKREIVNSQGKVEVVTTLTLREKTEKKIRVDQQVTVIRLESTLENEPQSLDYAAKFEMPEGMKLESFALPSLKAQQTGIDDIEVLGKTYEADVFEWVEQNERGPMSVKLWRSDEIPGSTLKEESVVKNGNDRILEMVIEINIPEEKK